MDDRNNWQFKVLQFHHYVKARFRHETLISRRPFSGFLIDKTCPYRVTLKTCPEPAEG
jgi:hypothetical protein